MKTDPVAVRFMQRAMDLAGNGRGTTQPNPRVGCLIVSNGEVVGEGWHRRSGESHAEVLALEQAQTRARGATAYVTLEPCVHYGQTPPCTEALIAAGVKRVVVAMKDPDPRVSGCGLQRLVESGLSVEIGICGDAALELNRGFVSRMTRGRPWLTLKLAASLDGRTGMSSGESRWITGSMARADVHRLRAEAGAVLTSSSTVLRDDPRLDVRLPGDWRQPDRIVLDAFGRIPFDAKVWRAGARRYVFMKPDACAVRGDRFKQMGVSVVPIALDKEKKVNLDTVLKHLATVEINELFAECGSELAGSFVDGGYVDELVLYLAPRLLGQQAQPLARIHGLERLADSPRFRYLTTDLVGNDLRLVLHPSERRETGGSY